MDEVGAMDHVTVTATSLSRGPPPSYIPSNTQDFVVSLVLIAIVILVVVVTIGMSVKNLFKMFQSFRIRKQKSAGLGDVTGSVYTSSEAALGIFPSGSTKMVNRLPVQQLPSVQEDSLAKI
jgi:hypothetical protein